ncbi:uncharacterized protein PAC_12886 [Phialocephala subalpina]|uniref:Heterokaryon incompatibility domain-containing protein n=1 Tax=Phialocephala subalpina TaxID=576137 RepID=A0A1L7XD72_9HELO|nr:uncharacterized protein PAC_12886 [Phialocephala subalpina]
MDEELDKTLNRKGGFKYIAIDAKQQCRLLRISHDQTCQTPIYSLEVVSLEDLPSTNYKALSYTWGHAHTLANIRKIQINAQPFLIRRNLFDFLSTATTRHETGLFFIDAICINQLDLCERESQVREMTRIYRNADEVIAWLGLPVSEQVGNVRALSKTSRSDCASWTGEEWAGFKYLSYQKFWSRIWIVQEVLLASSMSVWCGPFTFPLSLFGGTSGTHPSHELGVATNGRPSTVVDYTSRLSSPAEIITTHRLRYVPRPLRDPLAQGTIVGTMDETKRDLKKATEAIVTYQSPIADLLYQLIRKFRKLECSDPRDRLYGFLGILNEKSRAKVDVDYEKDVSYAYYQALKIGLQELYAERGVVVIPERSTTYIAYYCDVRDAFGIEDRESLKILRLVLDEVQFQTRLQDAVFETQWEQQFVLQDSVIQVHPDLKELLMHANPRHAGTEDVYVLSNFHTRQRRAVENLLSWLRTRSRLRKRWRQLGKPLTKLA